MFRKTTYVLILTPLVAGLLGCATSSGQMSAHEETGGGDVRVYEVFGMDCPGCHGGLEKLVCKIPAVEGAEAKWEADSLAITLRPDGELDDEAVYDAIRRANFTPGKRTQ
jgi:hypothetical protein